MLWILSSPWLARKVYTQEKALNTAIDTAFDKDPLLMEAFKRLKGDIEEISGKNEAEMTAKYIRDHLSTMGEVYT